MTTYYMDAVQDTPPRPRWSRRSRRTARNPMARAVLQLCGGAGWAQAVEQAGTTDAAGSPRRCAEEQFDTVLGPIGFDAKGDVTGFDPFAWYVWTDGRYVPKDLTE